MKCKFCGSERVIKNGKREKRQCYMCKDCKRQFVSELSRHEKWEERMAVSLYSAGLSFRTIGALFCVNCSTIYRWVKGFSILNCENPLPKGEIIVEADEMRRFIRSRKTNCGCGKRDAERLDVLLTASADTKPKRSLKEYTT